MVSSFSHFYWLKARWRAQLPQALPLISTLCK